MNTTFSWTQQKYGASFTGERLLWNEYNLGGVIFKILMEPRKRVALWISNYFDNVMQNVCSLYYRSQFQKRRRKYRNEVKLQLLNMPLPIFVNVCVFQYFFCVHMHLQASMLLTRVCYHVCVGMACVCMHECIHAYICSSLTGCCTM